MSDFIDFIRDLSETQWTEADEIGAVTAHETKTITKSTAPQPQPQFPCPHGRAAWQMCPHCLGLNNYTFLPEKP